MKTPQTVREQADRLLRFLRHASRFYGMGILLLLIGGAVALGVAVTRPRIYRSEALIAYRERIAARALGNDAADDPARRMGMRLRELVLSRSSLERIINEFRLYPEQVEDRGIAEAVDLMRTKVGFKAREGDIYALSFEGPDPVQVQKVTQRLTDSLVKENESIVVTGAEATKEFLDVEVKRTEEELKKLEERLAKFLHENPAFAAEGRTTGAGLGITANESKKGGGGGGGGHRRSTDPKIEAIEREIDRIQARLSPTIPAAQTLPPEVRELSEGWNHKKTEASRELEAAQRDLAEKRQSFTDEHPDVKRALSRVKTAISHLDEVSIQGAREVSRAQGKVPAPVQPLSPEERQKLQQDLQNRQQEVARLKSASRKSESADKEPDKATTAATDAQNIIDLETTYQQLTREVKDEREQVEVLKARRSAAELRERGVQGGSGRMQVIDPPYKPTRPARGGRAQAAAIGGALALFVALLCMLLRALLDDRVYDRFDIERLELGPLLATVPTASYTRQPAERLPRAQQRERDPGQDKARARGGSPGPGPGGAAPDPKKAPGGKDRKVGHA